MALSMSPELWREICEAAAMYPTCTLHLYQHEGWVKSFSIEHRMRPCDDGSLPPRHVKPALSAPKTKMS